MKLHLRKIIGLAALIVGLALCGVGFWLLLSPPQYAATVRIKIEQEDESIGVVTYDPYFIQTTFEIITSELVLSNVVADLNLKEMWRKKNSHGNPLKTARCYAILRRHIRLTPIGKKFVDITYYGDTPKEAVDVANAIAESYQKYRVESLTIQRLRRIRALQQQFQNEDEKIMILQTNVERLRQKYGIQDNASTNRLPQQHPYWDIKDQLDRLKERHKVLAIKIRAAKLVMNVRNVNVVPIIHQAEPSQYSSGRNRPLGAVLLALGMFPLLGGILLLKSKS